MTAPPTRPQRSRRPWWLRRASSSTPRHLQGSEVMLTGPEARDVYMARSARGNVATDWQTVGQDIRNAMLAAQLDEALVMRERSGPR